jgi:hypothetical protein
MAKVEKTEVVVGQQKFAAIDVSKLKAKAMIVMPPLSIAGIKDGSSFIVRILSEIKKSEQKDEKGEVKIGKDGNPEMIYTANAVNVETGEYGNMVLPIIVRNGLESLGEISGRIFALRKIKTNTGKATQWEVAELEE